MPRTEYEIAQDEHDALNLLLSVDLLLREFPIRDPRKDAFHESVQHLLDRRGKRFHQQHDSHITDLRTTCESVTGA